MYPFPNVQELEFLTAGQSTLDTVTFGRYIVHFQFDSGARISWEAALSYVDACGVLLDYTQPWASQGPCLLHALLGKKVVGIERQDWTLTLQFETGEQLRLHTNDDPYEAGTVSDPTQTFVF